MRFEVAAFISAMAIAGVNAQSDSEDVNWSDVNENIRAKWCQNQEATCKNICWDLDQETRENYCDYETLAYSCVCDSGEVPDLKIYSLTIPFFMCQQEVEVCQENCGGDNNCKSDCVQNKPCGAQPPPSNKTTTAAGDSQPTKTKSAADDKFTGGFGSDGDNGNDEEGDGEESAGVRMIGQAGLGLAIMGIGAAMTLFL